MSDIGLASETYVSDEPAVRPMAVSIGLADRRPVDGEEGPRMDLASYENTEKVLIRALGEELRRVRDTVGWTQKELVDRLPSEIHARTYATYELGTRHCTVARFVELCWVLGVVPTDVLSLALQRARIDLDGITIQVDLNAVAELNDSRPENEALRRWAQNRLASPDAPRIARLTRDVIQEMAALVGFTRAELVARLATFTPQAAPQC